MNRTLKQSTTVAGVAAAGLLLWGAHVQFPMESHAKNVYLEKTAVEQTVPAIQTPATKLVPDFTALAEEMSPTVVNIYTTSGTNPRARRGGGGFPPELEEQMQRYFGGGLPFNMPEMKREALGSGFVINADKGYIATNAHVVRMAGKNADEIMVKFIGEENAKGHLAKVVGADEASDVALLKLVDKPAKLKAAALGDSGKAKVGEWVLAIGNPYGHTHTVTQGIVSALGRTLEGARSEFMQTSAGINPGNSGGPLINMAGEVVGINSAMDPRAQSIGFAIPINVAKNVLNQLEDKGRVDRAWLGVAIDDLTEEQVAMMRLKAKEGVLVRQVVANAPAAKAGIEPYDVIKKIDGNEVKNTHDLFRTIDQLSSGKTANVEVLRGGATKTIKVTLGQQPTAES